MHKASPSFLESLVFSVIFISLGDHTWTLNCQHPRQISLGTYQNRKRLRQNLVNKRTDVFKFVDAARKLGNRLDLVRSKGDASQFKFQMCQLEWSELYNKHCATYFIKSNKLNQNKIATGVFLKRLCRVMSVHGHAKLVKSVSCVCACAMRVNKGKFRKEKNGDRNGPAARTQADSNGVAKAYI